MAYHLLNTSLFKSKHLPLIYKISYLFPALRLEIYYGIKMLPYGNWKYWLILATTVQLQF